MIPKWYDKLIFRLFRWRWNRIFASNPVYRELFIAHLKAYDTVDVGTKIIVSITNADNDTTKS